VSNDNARDQDRAWQLMKKIGFAMLVTHDRGQKYVSIAGTATGTRPDIGENRKVSM